MKKRIIVLFLLIVSLWVSTPSNAVNDIGNEKRDIYYFAVPYLGSYDKQIVSVYPSQLSMYYEINVTANTLGSLEIYATEWNEVDDSYYNDTENKILDVNGIQGTISVIYKPEVLYQVFLTIQGIQEINSQIEITIETVGGDDIIERFLPNSSGAIGNIDKLVRPVTLYELDKIKNLSVIALTDGPLLDIYFIKNFSFDIPFENQLNNSLKNVKMETNISYISLEIDENMTGTVTIILFNPLNKTGKFGLIESYLERSELSSPSQTSELSSPSQTSETSGIPTTNAQFLIGFIGLSIIYIKRRRINKGD